MSQPQETATNPLSVETTAEEESKEKQVMLDLMIGADEEGSKLEERLPIVDMPMDGTEPQASSLKRNIIETKLIS